jgi:SAM-dependent methyltransferase
VTSSYIDGVEIQMTTEQGKMRSYASETSGVGAFLREMGSLYSLYSKSMSERVRIALEDVRKVEARIKEKYDVDIKNLDVLEIGPGQFLTQLTYFATRNRVVGVDRDIIVRGFQPLAYVGMLQANGPRRTIKTIGRKLLGFDRQYGSQLVRQLGIKRLPQLTTRTMDVRRMTFANQSFDFVYSRSVLHHLPDPGTALREIARVLRPGGVAYVTIHPYTSATGCLDARVHTAQRHEIDGWPHLRPQLRDRVYAPNAHLNKFRLADWRGVFTTEMPGAECVLTNSGEEGIVESAQSLQGQGELLDYSLEELIVGEFASLWKKPANI